VLEEQHNPFVSMLRDLPIPFVTAVNGAAAGVGCSYALLGDIIVASERAYFLQAFRAIGLVPDGSATYHLPRMTTRARAMEMMLLGEKLPAAKALEWGLINRCVPETDLMSAAMTIATDLANGPTKALAMIRSLAWRSLDASWKEQLQAEREAQRDADRTEDFGEGVQAFYQKRPANFKGT
jgi:2-(1,2-epoxy-1,2-dihydrophenyl)acetyl-CoA isomerase